MDSEQYLIKKKLSIALRRFILTETPSQKLSEYIGIDRYQLRTYIEKQFTPEMSWDNYGEVWQFDHIAPVELFDLTSEDDKRLAWNYRNLQPKLCKENKLKGASVLEAQHEIAIRAKYAPNCPILKAIQSKVDSASRAMVRPPEFYQNLFS